MKPTNSKKTLTNSEANCFRACARKHYHQYIQLRRSNTRSEALVKGSLVHGGLERLMLGQGLGAAVRWMRKQELSFEFAVPQAVAMVTGHSVFWENCPKQLEVLEVEKEFKMPFKSPLTKKGWAQERTLAGKLDAIVKMDGKTYVMEHKTSSEDIGAGSIYWRRLRLDSQASMYMEAARHLGYDVSGVLYNLLRKPRIRPYKVNTRRDRDEEPEEYLKRAMEHIGANPDDYYQRGIVTRSDEELLEARTDLWLTHKMMLLTGRMPTAPRNVTNCFKYHRLCDYFEVCSGTASINDNTLFTTAEVKHAELEIS